MKKIKTIVLLSILLNFPGIVWGNTLSVTSINTTAQSPQEYLQQVYQQNKYAIEQLEKILRADKKRPYRVGAQLKSVDIPMLVFKLNSLNYLLQQHSQPEVSFVYLPLKQNLALNYEELLQQSQNFLLNLNTLFKERPSLTQDKYKPSSTAGWFTQSATPIIIYQQLLRIEQYLYGLKTIINPKGVYEIVLSTRDIIINSCTNTTIKKTPLIMGKRPKDVYSKLFEYLSLLSNHTKVTMPERGPVHALPVDVFDIALIAMVYSIGIDEPSLTKIINIKANSITNKPDFITPSHVYQAVTQNIKILECVTNAS